MTNDNPTPNESIDSRTVRALVEPLTVLSHDETPIDDADTTIVTVTSASGSTYDVDVRGDGRCTCPDAEYNLDDDERCKHQIRARVALGRDVVDADAIRALDVDPQLAEHAPGPKVLASDGGVIGGDGAELVDDDAPATWKGPFPEYNRYGEPTGARYVRCSECGVEVLEGETAHATHRDGCEK